MFGNFQVNMEGNQNMNEAMEICKNHPQCVDCPLADKPMNINGATMTCVNVQVFQKGSNK